MKLASLIVIIGLISSVLHGCTPKQEANDSMSTIEPVNQTQTTNNTDQPEPVNQSSDQTVGEIAPIPFIIQPSTIESGSHNGGVQEAAVFSETIQVPGATWLQVTFANYNLGSQSYILVKSILDGAEQKLTTESIQNWTTTAAFNGDTLNVDLYVHPNDSDVFFSIKELVVGQPYTP